MYHMRNCCYTAAVLFLLLVHTTGAPAVSAGCTCMPCSLSLSLISDLSIYYTSILLCDRYLSPSRSIGANEHSSPHVRTSNSWKNGLASLTVMVSQAALPQLAVSSPMPHVHTQTEQKCSVRVRVTAVSECGLACNTATPRAPNSEFNNHLRGPALQPV